MMANRSIGNAVTSAARSANTKEIIVQRAFTAHCMQASSIVSDATFMTCTRHQAIPEEKVLHCGCPVEGSRVSVVDSEGQRVGDVIVKIFTYASSNRKYFRQDDYMSFGTLNKPENPLLYSSIFDSK